MEIIFLAIDAPWWVFLLAGLAGVLIYLRFSFGSLSRAANIVLFLLLIFSMSGCQINDENLVLACMSYLIMVLGSFVFLLAVELLVYYFCRHADRKALEARLRRHEECSLPSGEIHSSEYY